MISKSEKEPKTEPLYIPTNYKGETGVWILVFNTRRMIEGVILGALFVIIAISLCRYYEVEITNFRQYVYIAILGIVGVTIGAIGANGESLFQFLKHLLMYFKKKRVSFYNPRLKTEYEPLINVLQKGGNQNMLPKDKLIKLYRSLISKSSKAEQTVEYDESTMFFKDDKENATETKVKTNRRKNKLKSTIRKLLRKGGNNNVKETKQKKIAQRIK